MTKQRKLILGVLRDSLDHPTAEQVYLKAKQQLSTLAMGTVYRNLSLMAELGEIQRIAVKDGPDRYDPNPAPHHHSICTRCAGISDVALFDLRQFIELQTGIDVLSYDLNIRCVCSRCRENEAHTPAGVAENRV